MNDQSYMNFASKMPLNNKAPVAAYENDKNLQPSHSSHNLNLNRLEQKLPNSIKNFIKSRSSVDVNQIRTIDPPVQVYFSRRSMSKVAVPKHSLNSSQSSESSARAQKTNRSYFILNERIKKVEERMARGSLPPLKDIERLAGNMQVNQVDVFSFK
jgi:hypothetical protein